MRKANINKDKLRKLYEEDSMTVWQIASKLNTSASTISAYLRKFGIPVRQRKIVISTDLLKKFQSGELTVVQIAKKTGTDVPIVYRRLKEHGIKAPGRRIDLPHDMLVKMYVNEKKTAAQIADELGVNRHLVQYNLKRYNISRRPTNSKKRIAEPDKQTLEQMYVSGRMRVPDISVKLGCSRDTVYKCLEKYGIKRRKSGPLLKFEITESELRRLYEVKRWNTKRIAEHFEVQPGSIVFRLNKFGIVVRGRKLTNILTKDLLKQLHVKDKLTLDEIAKKYNTAPNTVRSYLKKYKLLIPRRDYSSPHYAYRRQSRKEAKKHLAEMHALLGGKCAICGRQPPAARSLPIHHMWYLPNDVVSANYASGHSDEYHNELYHLVIKQPQRFRLLCDNCHLIITKYQAYPENKRHNLLKTARYMYAMRMEHTTTYDSLLTNSTSYSENNNGGNV